MAIAVELDGKKVGRIRLRQVPDASSKSLVGFIADSVEGVLTPTGGRCEVEFEMEVEVDEVEDIYDIEFAGAVREQRWEDIEPWS